MTALMKSSLGQRLLKKKLNNKGFTLIELIIVIVILAILAAVLIPLIGGYVREARESSVIADARNAFMAASMLAAADFSGGGAPDGAYAIPAARFAGLINLPVANITTCTLVEGGITAFVYTDGGMTVTYNNATGDFIVTRS